MVGSVGFVGLGVMGAGMARNLVAKGVPLTVYSRDGAKAAAFESLGAAVAPELPALGAACDVVVLSLPTTEIVEEVVFGGEGLAQTLRRGTVIIDTSTISAQRTREFAVRLAERGVDLLDAPVSGGQKGANDGTLTCMVGGSQEAFDRCAPIFQAMAKTITRIGESGAGQVCKACNQICVIASMLGAAEMVAVCLKSGLDPMVVRSALLGGSARSAVLENHALRVIDRTYTPGFRADLLLKDLRLALELERSLGVHAPATEAAEPLFARMVADGMAGLDWSAVGLLIQQMSGLHEPGVDRKHPIHST
ncbi:MAG TPA: NAD(P)-dependent oxidoreductase [Ramlibacter sp.]|jgi:2-hydroxy-3-oxopropionate reductase|nr:NAD(P)-dependent oxidoreductase [Ramlibacter sp.]